MNRTAALVLALLFGASVVHAQNVPLQAGPVTPGHAPMYSSSGTMQPTIQDSGTSGGGAEGTNLGELGVTSISPTNTYPSTSSGNGPNAEHVCLYDAPTTNSTGYHYFCFDPNSQGGGLMTYGAAGGASPLPFQFLMNGTVINLTDLLSASGSYTWTGNNTWTGSTTYSGPFISGGTAPTLTTGGCSGSSWVGGATVGQFTAATCSAAGYVLSGLPTAPNGYVCSAWDMTTPDDTLVQTHNTTRSCTLKSTTVSGDTIVVQALAY